MSFNPYPKEVQTGVKKHKGNKKKYIKPKRKNVKTPTPIGDKKCQGCGTKHDLSIHHVFFGSGQRDFSSQWHCVEWLEWNCHQSSYGIHGKKTPNYALDYELKVKHQQRLLNEGMTIKEFIMYFGMDYISMSYKGYIKWREKNL